MKNEFVCASLAHLVYAMSFEDRLDTETGTEKILRSENVYLSNLQFVEKYTNFLDMQCVLYRFENRFFLVFRGSESMKDWMMNSLALGKKVSDGGFGQQVKVHSGFWKQLTNGEAMCHVSSTLNRQATELKAGPKIPRVSLVCTGHSLGGAQAILAAYWLYRKLHHDFHFNVSVIAFGAPRCVAQGHLAGFMSRTGVQIRNFIHGGDPVPCLPPFSFSHPGHVFQFWAGQWYLVQANGQDTACSKKPPIRGIWHLRPRDHGMQLYLQAVLQPFSFARL